MNVNKTCDLLENVNKKNIDCIQLCNLFFDRNVHYVIFIF